MHHAIRVLIVDDHGLVRDSVASRLAADDAIEVLATAADADEALEKAVDLKPDIVLMDIDMPGRLCFDVARTLGTRVPETRVLFLSAHCNDSYIQDALRVNAAGYITKSEPMSTIIDAINAVASGGSFFSRDVQARLVVDSRGVRLAEATTRVNTLSPREMEVLRYVARGMSKKEIASAMHISVKTVDNHSTSLMAKLDLHDRVELTRFAIRERIAEA